jgi:hypothetical protein
MNAPAFLRDRCERKARPSYDAGVESIEDSRASRDAEIDNIKESPDAFHDLAWWAAERERVGTDWHSLSLNTVRAYDGRDCLDFILRWGKLGPEAIDRDENSLGAFASQRAATLAITQKSFSAKSPAARADGAKGTYCDGDVHQKRDSAQA